VTSRPFLLFMLALGPVFAQNRWPDGTEPGMSEDRIEQGPDDERDKLDATGEFFSVGAPLHAVRAGYIRRKADDVLYETVSAGRYAHVLAPERSGKSSLIAATAARLENNGCKVAILDLQQIGVRDAGTDSGRWYYNVAYRLLRQLRIRYDLQSWWQDKSILSNRQRLLDFYSEVILQFVPDRIVVFIDEIQCIENLPFADQLLASIRAAHNARTTNPDFSRLAFVLLGECDPLSLIQEPEASPFNITQQVVLEDFSREQLDAFATELNLDARDAAAALDRIYYWTHGQPYLCQKLARALSREEFSGDVTAEVDRIALQQLAGRAALHNEPHMSHIHRFVVNSDKRGESMLNLYGKVRKGIEVAADLGSPTQRRLMAVGLLVVDSDGNLRVRNRLYASVFTARWANENLPNDLRVPLIAVAALILFALVPFWYTQWLSRPYLETLTSPTVELPVASEAWENFRSFPGHADTADRLYRGFLEQRARAATNVAEIDALAAMAAELPDAGRLPDSLRAQYWDRVSSAAMWNEHRDEALLATLQSLVLSTTRRRQRAAGLVADDYPLLRASLSEPHRPIIAFDDDNMILTAAEGSTIMQWSFGTQELQARPSWQITALEVLPLVRRVFVDREGVVNRVGLTLNISHARLSDLRIKVIAPSGRAVEVESGMERASSGDDIRIPAAQLSELVGESLAGTWSISVRDESLGVAGQLVGWNLTLNSQAAIEDFQRGLNIPDPVERETDNVWFDSSGRYAVARTTQSDSARVWDLAFSEPIRAVAVNENEKLIGLDAGARHLVTATQQSVNLWDTATGDRTVSLPVGAASANVMMTEAGTQLLVERRTDTESRLELWSLDSGEVTADIVIGGVPSLVAIDASGARVAVADYDRAIRVWDIRSGDLLAQIDLAVQPSRIQLSAGGDTLGVVHGESGISLWKVADPQRSLLQEFGTGNWHLAFSPSGASVLAGRADLGFQLYRSSDGRLVGPLLDTGSDPASVDMLAFSADEQFIVSGDSFGTVRFWRAPKVPAADAEAAASGGHVVWRPAADSVLAALPGAARLAIGDDAGHVHFLAANAGISAAIEISEDVSFVGHTAAVSALSVDKTGTLVASTATDNSVRVWDTRSGQPLPYMLESHAESASRVVFSPDSSMLAILRGDHVDVIEVANGKRLAQADLGSEHRSIAFAADERIYVGGEDGVLQLLSSAGDGNWTLQRIWQGPSAIRRVEVSPRGSNLVLVDAKNLATQFILAAGQVSDATLQLPATVAEVTFNPTGTRVYFRTSRWVHRASASASGLIHVDSAFAPKALRGARLVFGDPQTTAAKQVFLPTARNGFVELFELGFGQSQRSGLFGSREKLLLEWRQRFGLVAGNSAE